VNEKKDDSGQNRTARMPRPAGRTHAHVVNSHLSGKSEVIEVDVAKVLLEEKKVSAEMRNSLKPAYL
jgi:hypothetical protein